MVISDDFLLVISFTAFITAVIIRLLDTSGSILLKNGVYIISSYPPRSFLREYMSKETPVILKNKLRKIFILRNAHNFHMVIAIVSFFWVIARNILLFNL